ncbi:MAG: Holliday junction resolvase RuvX [Zetaproteobacteria bacterium]|nr:MAG: Holliday junction resolvase RuvX [Zetaproteobacteria bacterium]
MDLLQKNYSDCPVGVVLMGLDLGSKTIGVSISDSSQSIAFPLRTLKRTKFSRDLKSIEDIIREYNVGGYIFGYPLNMDDSAGPRCQSVRDFGLEFTAQISDDLKDKSMWIGLWDERLSTNVVKDFVDKSVNISKRRAKDTGLIDKLAAQHILQGALDFLSHRR